MVRPRLILVACLATSCTHTPPTPPSTAPLIAPEPAPSGFATDAERERCDEIVSATTCPPQTQLDVFLGPKSEEGSVFCEVRCLRGEIPHGPYAIVNVSRDGLEQRGTFENGKKHGLWTSWRDDPETLERVKVDEQQFLHGTAHGPYRAWYPDGQIKAEGSYVDGERDGTWKEYAPDGTWTFDGTFDHGVPLGTHRERYLNGQMMSQRVYDELGRPDGEWCFWLPSGVEVDCYTIEDGTGTIREHDRSGKLTRKYEIRDGKRHGTYVEYTFDGGRYEAEYEEGQQDGEERVFVGDCVQRLVTWANDEEDGPTFEQNCGEPSTLVRVSEGQNCHGEPCGRWTRRDSETGATLEVTEYSDSGETIGRLRYGPDGEIVEFWGSIAP